MTQKTVYQTIAAVMRDISKEGIAKGRKNAQQGYNFRGIDDVYNVLSPILAHHGLVILPRVIHREQVERQTAKGGALFYTTLTVEFDFVSADDGSKHTVTTIGEAMDSADKSANKAMSAAYKYACFQTFAIPTEGDNDADAHTHEVRIATVTAKQAEAIKDALEASGRDVEAFMNWVSEKSGQTIMKFGDIPAAAYDTIMNKLAKVAA